MIEGALVFPDVSVDMIDAYYAGRRSFVHGGPQLSGIAFRFLGLVPPHLFCSLFIRDTNPRHVVERSMPKGYLSCPHHTPAAETTEDEMAKVFVTGSLDGRA